MMRYTTRGIGFSFPKNSIHANRTGANARMRTSHSLPTALKTDAIEHVKVLSMDAELSVPNVALMCGEVSKGRPQSPALQIVSRCAWPIRCRPAFARES